MELPILRENIFLIGDLDIRLSGNKLPTSLEVLKVLFFHLRVLKEDLPTSIASVVDEVLVFWNKAKIPTSRVDLCRDQLRTLYEEWRVLGKHKDRNIQGQELFAQSIRKLFDVARKDALNLISEEAQIFLHNQRSDGRFGQIRMDHDELNLASQTSSLSIEEQADDTVELLASGLSSGSTGTRGAAVDLSSSQPITSATSSGELYGEPDPKRRRATKNIVSEKLVGALDRFSITDRQACHLVTAVCDSLQENNALSVDVCDIIVNTSSILRYRENIRELEYEQIRKDFSDLNLKTLVVHWDGKLLPDLVGMKNVDRLPIIVNSGNEEFLLGVPKLENGTGLAQATSIYETLCGWGINDCIKAICCDTTAANLGRLNGAAMNLEKFVGQDLLYLACRHHIFELVLRAVFETSFPGTTRPSVLMFKKFQTAWNEINASNYKSGMEDQKTSELLKDKIDDIKRDISDFISQAHPRDDYRELLELVLVFIGADSGDYRFSKPGAFHHARWMAKAIYVLKMYLLRAEYKLKAKEENKLRDICIFITIIYVRAWFTAPIARKAPNSDLLLLKEIDAYKLINDSLANAVFNKFKNHLWYLSPELAMLSLFDESVSLELKGKIVDKLNNLPETKSQASFTTDEDDNDYTDEENPIKRYEVNNLNDLLDKDIDYFINSQSLNFFKRFDLSTKFLQSPPSEWIQNTAFKEASAFVAKLKVVNDCAERAVKLMEDYNGKFTTDEMQQQYIVQIVKAHREKYPIDSKRENM